MNNAFKQNKILVLSENYLIKPDNNNGVILVFTEQVKVKKYDDVLEFDYEETVTKTESWQYPRIAQALRKYADLEIMVEDNIEAMIAVSEKVYKLIDRIDTTFKQF
jgi:hypothetical protein